MAGHRVWQGVVYGRPSCVADHRVWQGIVYGRPSCMAGHRAWQGIAHGRASPPRAPCIACHWGRLPVPGGSESPGSGSRCGQGHMQGGGMQGRDTCMRGTCGSGTQQAMRAASWLVQGGSHRGGATRTSMNTISGRSCPAAFRVSSSEILLPNASSEASLRAFCMPPQPLCPCAPVCPRRLNWLMMTPINMLSIITCTGPGVNWGGEG